MLAVRVRSRRGETSLDVEFEAPAAATTVLVGESGVGKTSVLRLIAGLDAPDSGTIALDATVWLDTAAGISRPVWKREIGYLPQDYALFPHLSVGDNVAFGLREQGVSRREARLRALEALRRTGVDDLAGRAPPTLSGGQQQRAALARALALDPGVLLLDEPLAALDAASRRAVRTELRALLRTLACVTIYVTHNPVEALLFGDRIVVLENGRVSQSGSRDDLLRHPRSRYVAELLGTNLFAGTVVDGSGGTARVRTAEGEITVAGAEASDTFFMVDPSQITLHHHPPEGSAQNSFQGPILELVPEPPAGARVRVALGTRPPILADVTREAVASLGLREGLPVYATFKATGVRAYR